MKEREKYEKVMEDFINFFKEFDFEPSIRFIDTLSITLKQKGQNAAINYIVRTFELMDSPEYLAIKEKLKSTEIKYLLTELSKLNINKNINRRLSIYFGPAGTGKTSLAIKESQGKVICCHSGMMPEDLLEDFDFNDVNGHPVYKPSALQESMTSGTKVVLDEINLLPFETVRFLQTLTDGKPNIIFKNKVINIKDGFKIIGTMNLKVGNQIFPLPAPLVDRADELRRFSITKEMLTDFLM